MSQTILFKDGLRIGKRELQLLQTLGLENLSGMAQALAQSVPAVITAVSGQLDTSLQVTAAGTDLTIAVGSAFLKNGTFLEVGSPITPVTVGVGVTNQPVVLAASATSIAAGTMEVSAGDRFTLTYTPAGGVVNAEELYTAGDSIRLLDGGSPLGTFRIDTVSTNTILLVDAVPGASTITGMTHALAGKFFPGYPLSPETTDLLQYDTPAVRIETQGYTAADNEIILATVTRVGSNVTVTDARVAFQARGLNNIVDSMVAANASIAESKLALSSELVRAKTFSPFLGVTADNKLFTTQPDFYVTREGQLRRVLLATEVLVPAFTDLSVTPGTASITAGGTQAIVASVTNAPGESPTVTYAFSSLTPSVATVSQTVVGSVNATITGVSSGSALILVTATAPATGSAVAAQETVLVPVSITASNASLTSLSLSPSTLTLGRLSAPVTVTATATPAAGAAPSITYAWEYVGTASDVVTLSTTSGASVDISPKIPGTAQIRVTASGTASNGYEAVTLPSVTFNVTVTEGLALSAEPGYRVTFVRRSEATLAVFRWGIGGACTAAGLNITMTVDPDDRWVTLSTDALIGKTFHDTAGRRYIVASNAAYTPGGATLTFTVTKINATDANPATGTGVVRSSARAYSLAIFNQAGTSQLSPTHTPENTSVRSYEMPLSAAVPGTSYLFRLTAVDETLSPSTFTNDVVSAWGSSSTTPVDVPDTNWITATPTMSGVKFSWPILDDLQSNAFVKETMDYYVQWKIGDQGWSTWTRVEDNTPGLTSLEQFVFSPPDTLVQLRVKITDLSGTATVNGGAYDGTAAGVTLSNVTGGNDIQFDYPFDLTGAVWTLIDGRYYYPLARYVAGPSGSFTVPTTFTTTVSVTRIDLGFDGALVQDSGTAEVKVVVYPTENPSYQVAGDILQQGGSNYVQTTDIDTVVNVNRNGDITVALEYAGTLTGGQTPMSLNVDGDGRASVWFRGAPGAAV